MNDCCCPTQTRRNPWTVAIFLAVAAAVIGTAFWTTLRSRTPQPATAGENAAGATSRPATRPAGDEVLVLDRTNFDQGVAKGVTVVDFYADWCGPCRMMAPILHEVAHDLAGKARVAKVNVDDSQGLASRFRVRAIPLLVIMKDGKEVDRLVGLQTKRAVLRAVEKQL